MVENLKARFVQFEANVFAREQFLRQGTQKILLARAQRALYRLEVRPIFAPQKTRQWIEAVSGRGFKCARLVGAHHANRFYIQLSLDQIGIAFQYGRFGYLAQGKARIRQRLTHANLRFVARSQAQPDQTPHQRHFLDQALIDQTLIASGPSRQMYAVGFGAILFRDEIAVDRLA